MNKPSKSLLFSVVFMDMVGFGFIIPLLPDYLAAFGGSTTLFGVLMASYAFGQFIAAPVVGRLSDKFGRKPLLLFSIFGTFLSLITLGFAKSVPVLFASRLIDGFTGGNITVARAYITDITDNEDRASGLGIIGAAFGLGFVFGPLFGGLLVPFGLAVPAFTAAGIALANLLLISLVLPESHPVSKGEKTEGRRLQRFDIGAIWKALKNPVIGRFLHLTFMYTLAFNIFETMFSAHARQHLGLSPRTRSFVLVYVGVIVALVQGGGIKILTNRFKEEKILLVSAIGLALSLTGWALTGSLAMLLVVTFPLSVFSGIMGVMIRTLLTKSVPDSETGGTLGIATSIEAFNRVIAPLIGGLLLGRIGAWAPGAIGGLILSVCAVFILRKVRIEKRGDHETDGRD